MVVVDRPDALGDAASMLDDELHAIDRTCSRFRPDSEIRALHAEQGRPHPVSSLLFEAIAMSCAIAERTGGAVDPTIGCAIEALGYDRDFADVQRSDEPLHTSLEPAPGWWRIELDRRMRTVCLPRGAHLDLGACAKALAADRAAARIAAETGTGALVSLGGDVAVAGKAPQGGWPIAIAVDSAAAAGSAPVVAIRAGGLASSSTAVRTWCRNGRRLHHIVDPATGDCAGTFWRLVSVAAGTCVDANAASTASVVWGEDAPGRLDSLKLPARLVRDDGAVVTVAGWPPDPGSPDSAASERAGFGLAPSTEACRNSAPL
jgi:FAD:protein FMN transferase